MTQIQNCIEKVNFILQQGLITNQYISNNDILDIEDFKASIQIFRNYYSIEQYVSDSRAIQIYKNMVTQPSRKLWTKNKKILLTWILIKSHILSQYQIHIIPEPIQIFISQIFRTTPFVIKVRLIRIVKLPASLFPWMPEEDRCLTDLVLTQAKQTSYRKLKWRDISLELNIKTSLLLRSRQNCKQRWFENLQHNQEINNLDNTMNLMNQINKDQDYNRWSDHNIMQCSEQTIHKQYKKFIKQNKKMESMMNFVSHIIPMNVLQGYSVGEFYMNLISMTSRLQIQFLRNTQDIN